MQGLRPAHDRSQRFGGGPYNIIVGLLGGQRATCRLGVETHPPGAWILSFEPVSYNRSPHPSGCPELGNLFEKIEMRIEEEGKTRGKGINIQLLSFNDVLDICYPVSQSKSQFLDSGGASLPNVVTANAYGIPHGNMFGAELDSVAYQSN